MSMVYKGNFQNETIIQNVDLALNFFKSYNNAFAYSQTYEELYSDINLDEYVYTENGQVHIKVPEGFYYFMGDNSMESLDSRFFGFVPKENIIGALFLRIYPFDRFGKIN
jgi:signal peptidase I